MANRVEAARSFITLPAEVWAIALKTLVFLKRRGIEKKEVTYPRMTAHELLNCLFDE